MGTEMRIISRHAIVAAVGVFAAAVAVGPSAAADFGIEEAPAPQYIDGEAAPVEPQIEEGYVDRGPPRIYREAEPPVVYAAPPMVYAPPPPVYYAPAPVVVAPPAYYVRPYPYRVPAYVVARRGPHVVRHVGRWVGPHPRRW
jgi:hypothetical protein